MRPRAIHQFHSGSAYGDGITNGMFFIQNILRRSGYVSDVYCGHIDARLSGQVLPVHDYENRAEDLLLVHYSLGTGLDDWISALRSPRILVYHNITPAHFFPDGNELRRLILSGRRQLARWARHGHFIGAIADSAFNARELEHWGFRPIAAIALLVDLDRLRRHGWNQDVAEATAGARHLLFVGRVCEHKGQADLVRMTASLARLVDFPIRLLLAGSVISDEYQDRIRDLIVGLGLTDSVRLLGRRDDEDVYALYRAADLYVSLSQHEGFGMPLVEAMAFDLPVLAAQAGNVAATLGPGGIVLEGATPERMAAAAKLILSEPPLRHQVVAGQRKSLARYERPVLVSALETFLHELGFDVALEKAARVVHPAQNEWRIEGPFDSSYSLAIVNRELARGLARAGEAVALSSRDGPGPFAPGEAFLALNPDIRAMAERGRAQAFYDNCLRNQYPPHVADMRGTVRVLANYAWEESGFPAEWVREFNASLDLITVTSSFVAKVLRDNGVRVPIRVVGNGVDPALAERAAPPDRRRSGGAFSFLHVSSGFPRKGLDVLLAAWGTAFSRNDAVELVIKTFHNVHNPIEAELRSFHAEYPNAAPVSLINKDLAADEMDGLYASADALVAPSRGEGFGLPMAEAMALGKPVITTAHGGQTDFCTSDTAWLCDYEFAYARTHLDVLDSVWAEPDRASLARALRDVFAASGEERARRAEAGRVLIGSEYTWDRVADRTRRAVAEVDRSSGDALRLPVIGVVSTWNSRCGIADYAQSLMRGIEPERLRVFATKVPNVLEPDTIGVRRCWVQGWDDPLAEMFQEICDAAVDAVVIQFNFGFFKLETLARLIARLHERGILVFITLHSTMDVFKPEYTLRLAEIAPAFASVCRLLVHSVHDLNRLKAIGLVDNVALFPMGIPRPAPRGSIGREGGTIVASFGYLLPHKGLRELIRGFALLRETIEDAHLLMLNALYPEPHSEAEMRACQDELRRLGIQDHATLVTDFLSEQEIVARLGAADVVVFPYQDTQESASAAVKMGLGSLTAVAVTPLSIFDDIATVSYALPGITPDDIARGLLALLSDDAGRAELTGRQRRWVEAHDWAIVSARLDGLIRGELEARRCPTNAPTGRGSV